MPLDHPSSPPSYPDFACTTWITRRGTRRASFKDAAGVPLTGHQHAYYLPRDQDGDGRIDQVLVRCAGGLGDVEQAALGCVSTLWQSKGRPDVQVVLVAKGQMAALESSRIWETVTPFVTKRHYRDSRGPFEVWLESEVLRAIRQQGPQQGLPDPHGRRQNVAFRLLHQPATRFPTSNASRFDLPPNLSLA